MCALDAPCSGHFGICWVIFFALSIKNIWGQGYYSTQILLLYYWRRSMQGHITHKEKSYMIHVQLTNLNLIYIASYLSFMSEWPTSNKIKNVNLIGQWPHMRSNQSKWIKSNASSNSKRCVWWCCHTVISIIFILILNRKIFLQSWKIHMFGCFLLMCTMHS